jgi:hypothetical protein
MNPFDLETPFVQLRAAVAQPIEDTTPAGRKDILGRMRLLSNVFYAGATKTGCHAMIEFTGLMNEFIQACREAEEQGIDWLHANVHGESHLQFGQERIAYITEKLECIFGLKVSAPARNSHRSPSVSADPELTQIILRERALNGKQNGREDIRLVVDLAQGKAQWANQVAERITGDWSPTIGILASERKCREKGFVPVGTILISIDKTLSHGKASKPSYSVGRVGITEIEWNVLVKLQHIRLSKNTDGKWIHTIIVDGKRYEVTSQ